MCRPSKKRRCPPLPRPHRSRNRSTAMFRRPLPPNCGFASPTAWCSTLGGPERSTADPRRGASSAGTGPGSAGADVRVVVDAGPRATGRCGCRRRECPAPHKRLQLELEDVGGRWSLRAREFDEPTHSWSEWVADRTSDESRLAMCAAGLARRCFRPTALIDTFRGELRQVAVRGAMHWPASLPPPEAVPLEIWLLYLNKSKEIEKRQRAPWSYLVHEVSPGDTPPAPKWQVVSGVRGSLGTRSQRVLAVGLAVSVPVSGTRLVLRPWKSTVRAHSGGRSGPVGSRPGRPSHSGRPRHRRCPERSRRPERSGHPENSGGHRQSEGFERGRSPRQSRCRHEAGQRPAG